MTRARAEAVLLGVVRGWYEEVQFDVTHTDGTNADLAEPIGLALVQMGLALADPTNPTDSDLAGVTSATYERWLAYAQLAALYRVQGSLVGYSRRFGTTQTWQSDQSLALERAISNSEARIAKQWGTRGGGCAVGLLASTRNAWGYPRELGDCAERDRLRGRFVSDTLGPFHPLPESLW